jgi:hypothetical protein
MPRQKTAPKPAPVVELPQEPGLYVYADFETYKAGDKFDLPEGWYHDAEYEDVLLTKNKAREGMVFQTPTGKRVVLPIREV